MGSNMLNSFKYAFNSSNFDFFVLLNYLKISSLLTVKIPDSLIESIWQLRRRSISEKEFNSIAKDGLGCFGGFT